MKKVSILSFLALGVIACSGPTEDQKKAATEFCECMEKEVVGDFDIDYYECDNEVKAKYEGEVFADENYLKALEEKCPDVASKIE
ncbi:MAG: hypothetical protein ACWA41_08465 [Putridiphycobacter sp.]